MDGYLPKPLWKKIAVCHDVGDLRRNPTMYETMFGEQLKEGAIPNIFQKMFERKIKGRMKDYFIVDFYLPDIKVVIEVDDNSHNTTLRRTRDHWNFITLHKREGILLIRIRNDEVYNDHVYFEEVIKFLKWATENKVSKWPERDRPCKTMDDLWDVQDWVTDTGSYGVMYG